jgi:hypothetical protein
MESKRVATFYLLATGRKRRKVATDFLDRLCSQDSADVRQRSRTRGDEPKRRPKPTVVPSLPCIRIGLRPLLAILGSAATSSGFTVDLWDEGGRTRRGTTTAGSRHAGHPTGSLPPASVVAKRSGGPARGVLLPRGRKSSWRRSGNAGARRGCAPEFQPLVREHH